MANNPRKFAEKIALHNQKQAEETAAFEQIMREVSDATSQPEDVTSGQYGLTTKPQSQTTPTPQQQTRGRTTGVGPMRTRPQDRKIDTSPYSSNVYLSPPPDSSWRRTNSDSALHQSSVPRDPQGGSPHHHHHHGPNHHHHQTSFLDHHHLSSQLNSFSGQIGTLQQHSYSHSHGHGLNTALHHSPHLHRRDGNNDGIILETNPNRPRSSCDVPRVPGIHVYPSPHDGNGPQIPVGSNTGSLPDLSTFHFPAPPLHPSPLDRDIQDHSSSPYSTSPISASPVTLSPTSVPPLRQVHSPHHSPRSTPQTGSPTASTQYTNHHTPQNHLSVPNTNRYLHHSKGVTVDSTWGQSYQQQCSPPSLHSSHSNINISSPTVGVAPTQIGGVSNGGYRSPRSPGSSPGGAGGGGDSPHYDASGASYTSQSADYSNHALLQKHFEQISMDWAQLVQSLLESGVTWTAQVQVDSPAPSISFMGDMNPNQSQATLPVNDNGGGGGENISWSGGGGCSGAPICLQAGSCLGGPTCLSGPHPNTPTTIPNIILTDFSCTNTGGDLSRDLNSSLSSQISANLSSHFESSPLLLEDEALRDGLDPIDLDGFQMLTDPDMNVISDPTMEDCFRLDRL